MVFYQPDGSKDARQMVELEISPLYCHISRKKPWDAGDGLVIIFRLQTRHAQVLHTRPFGRRAQVKDLWTPVLSRDAAHSSFLRPRYTLLVPCTSENYILLIWEI
jgi:hypothetical protein